MTDNKPDDKPAPAKAADPEPERTGYAVYDNTLLKFVGGVVSSKTEADKLKRSGPASHDLEVRRV